jgi:hypothetical protein
MNHEGAKDTKEEKKKEEKCRGLAMLNPTYLTLFYTLCIVFNGALWTLKNF